MTPQRIAIAEYILKTKAHPHADAVWVHVRRRHPTISRATVYNTLNLFVEKGLVKAQPITGGAVIFDPNVRRHHHFIDEKSGIIYDLPWEAVKVTAERGLSGFEVREYQVVLRGRRRRR